MLCQNCHQKESTVYFTQFVNGQTAQMHLCQECANKMQGFGFSLHPGMVADFLQAIFGTHATGASEMSKLEQEKCPGCGRTFVQIRKSGRMGCSKCYEIFEPQMEQLLRRIHGGAVHVGKVPVRTGAVYRKKQEVNQLKNQLQELIRTEQFEEAAMVRDKIKEFHQQTGGEAGEA